MIACRKSFTDTLLELAKQDKDIIAVTTDARGSVTLNDFADQLPEQFVEWLSTNTNCWKTAPKN